MAYCNRGDLRNRIEDSEKALEDLLIADKLRKNKKNLINLSKGNKEFVDNTLTKIIDLQKA